MSALQKGKTMTNAEFLKRCRALYESGRVPAPEWEQLGKTFRLRDMCGWTYRVKDGDVWDFLDEDVLDHEAACIWEHALRVWLFAFKDRWTLCDAAVMYFDRTALLAACEALDKKVSDFGEGEIC